MDLLMPTRSDLWFLPLGGTGEIGMNLNLYGHDGEWLMVDCGVSFNEPLDENSVRTHELVCADPDFITQQRHRLAGIVITHAHEDHVGALPFLWRRFQVPVYTTPFTAEILRRKLAQVGLLEDVEIHELPLASRFKVGVFDLQWITLTHSIPEPSGLMIETPAGNVFHTGDWKIDHSPVIGERFSPAVLTTLRKRDVTAMVCDSTNALKTGHSVSEFDCYKALLEVIKDESGRVVVGCFSSNIARLVSLARVAKETGRYLALLGRSLQNMVSAARASGYWPDDLPVVDATHLGYLPADEVLAVATGSQGEPRAMLNRLARDDCFDLSLDKGDLVLFSAMIIPGNEAEIERLVKSFKAQGIRTLQKHETELPIHVSGHPYEEELAAMYDWVRPQVAIPTHGEAAHMSANARIAKDAHVPRQLTGLNGDLFTIAPEVGVRKRAVKAKRIALAR
ncbi:Ribonuclease J 1 [Marinomonas aquimarina]|uniref:Ribonuclease J 1 n=1 Tax=Marinomonas aquimarina TaxID=295068 RepID=A0A1A8TGK7_9GAMM|nr:ribonuclease J [Marinomonas aquimarina]SBS32315.1 Ribonuclease J 1 [Marinomonas aquimarina]